MARIAIVSLGIVACLHPSLALAERLRARGHRVVLFIQRRENADACARHSFECETFCDHDALAETVMARGLSSPGAAFDLALIESELECEILQILALGVPVVVSDYHCSPEHRPGIPPLSSHRCPDGSLRSSLRAELDWARLLVDRLLGRKWVRRRRRVRVLRRELRLGAEARTVYHHWQPIRFPALPYLHLRAPEFDFVPRACRHGHEGGPLVLTHGGRFQGDAQTEHRLGVIARARASRGLSQYLVYCSLGSLRYDDRFYGVVIELCRRQPEITVILATAAREERLALESCPPNLHLFRAVPQYRVLEMVDAAITAAGIATINECISAGVPMVSYSLGVLDQDGNAARVAYHGLGRRGDLSRDGPEALAAHLHEVTRDPRYRERVRTMQRAYRDHETQGRAVRLLEAVLAGDLAPETVGRGASPSRFSGKR